MNRQKLTLAFAAFAGVGLAAYLSKSDESEDNGPDVQINPTFEVPESRTEVEKETVRNGTGDHTESETTEEPEDDPNSNPPAEVETVDEDPGGDEE